MNVSFELSYYPLNPDYIEPILGFIQRLNNYENLICNTNGMSTQIFGDFDYVMDALKHEIKISFEVPNSVFVMKIINLDLK